MGLRKDRDKEGLQKWIEKLKKLAGMISPEDQGSISISADIQWAAENFRYGNPDQVVGVMDANNIPSDILLSAGGIDPPQVIESTIQQQSRVSRDSTTGDSMLGQTRLRKILTLLSLIYHNNGKFNTKQLAELTEIDSRIMGTYALEILSGARVTRLGRHYKGGLGLINAKIGPGKGGQLIWSVDLTKQADIEFLLNNRETLISEYPHLSHKHSLLEFLQQKLQNR